MRAQSNLLLSLFATALVGVVAACSASTDPDARRVGCGDGTCQAGETPTTCAVDCGARPDARPTPPDAPPGPVCGDGLCAGDEADTCPADCSVACTADPATCDGNTMCIAGSCQPAFGRPFRIAVTEIVIASLDGDGAAWDIGNGLPDAFSVITLNGTPVVTSTVVDNSLTPTWSNDSNPIAVPAAAIVRVEIYDEDIAVDDEIVICNINVTADMLHAGFAPCTNAVATARVEFAL